MQVTVWGAGAIGGITGAALARAGHDVLLAVKAHATSAAVEQIRPNLTDPTVGVSLRIGINGES